MEQIFTNCVMIMRNEQLRGSLVVEDGLIKDIDTTISSNSKAINLRGDLLLPGLIEMHTDNLEKNIQPRPGVIWPSILAAAMAHDVQIIGAGITTVFDAIAVGGLRESSLRSQIFNDSIDALCHGSTDKLFKSEHYLHLRCEVSDEHMEKMLLSHCDKSQVRLISIMDHTPGQRQWSDLSKWRLYHRDKKWTAEETEEILANRKEMQQRFAEKHRKLAVSIAKERKIPLASHDDTTESDIQTSSMEGIEIAEFPTSLDAARGAKEKRIKVIMGAPNAIRGESHSGNISAELLAEKHLLDGLSSDYVPASLLHSAFHLAERLDIPLHKTVAMVSSNIAEMVNLADRGELLPGKRADLLQVSPIDNLPILRKVWRQGMQVA